MKLLERFTIDELQQLIAAIDELQRLINLLDDEELTEARELLTHIDAEVGA
jgi:hypothetical protein